MRVCRDWESTGVVLGGRACVRDIEKATFCPGPHVEGNTVVIADPVILRVVDGAKARIESRWKCSLRFSNQVSGNGINVHAVGNLTTEVAVSNQVGGMGSTVNRAGHKMAAKSVFQGARKNVRGRGHDVRINPTNAQACAWNSSVGVQTRCDRAQSCASEGGKLESKRRFTAGTLDEDWPRRRICICRRKCRQDKSRRIAPEFFLNVGGRQPVRVHSEPYPQHP